MSPHPNPLNITLDAAVSAALSGALKTGEVISLPFAALLLWVNNGLASYKALGGPLHFGGFACSAEDIQEVIEQSSTHIPAGFAPVDIATRDGGEFPALATRSIAVAPIGKRESWLSNGKRYPNYVDGSRRHLQILAYLAERDLEAKSFTPWGPVVITAKGYQAKNLSAAFQAWDKASAPLRREIAPGVPSSAFFLQVGTFGKERIAMNVGKPGLQSAITPIVAYIPEPLSAENLGVYFVGNEVAAQMVELREQAQEWLEAWSKPNVAGNGEACEGENYSYGDNDVPF